MMHVLMVYANGRSYDYWWDTSENTLFDLHDIMFGKCQYDLVAIEILEVRNV
jgi:hypothetical protein